VFVFSPTASFRSVITSTKEVIFSTALVAICLFVSRVVQKLLNQFPQISVERLAHGPRKKPLDFGGNPDHVTLGSGSGSGSGLCSWLGGVDTGYALSGVCLA